MKKLLNITLILGLAISVFACSSQYRNTDLGKTNEEILEELDALLTVSAASTQFSSIANSDERAVIYYTEAPGSLGPIEAALTVFDLSFLGLPDYGPIDLTEVKIFFVGNENNVSEREFSLLIQFHAIDQEQAQVKVFDSVSFANIEDDRFSIELSDGSVSLFVESFDVIDGELSDVIQLKLYQVDQSGANVYLGKLNSMVGFSI